MFFVRFVRKDGKPDEEYFYQTESDAKYHFDLFEDDDSGLYSSIELGIWVAQKATILKVQSLQ